MRKWRDAIALDSPFLHDCDLIYDISFYLYGSQIVIIRMR